MSTFKLLIYYFCVTGAVLSTEVPALTPSHRPIKTFERCVERAEAQQDAMNAALKASHGGAFSEVVVLCLEVKNVRNK